MLTLFGNPVSTCTRKVLMTLAETNTPFEMKVIDFAKREHKDEPHLRRQPFGRIPALEDDGFEMFESRAICRYIDEKFKGNLVPSDLRARAKMEQWISVESSEFSPHAMKFVYDEVFRRPQGAAVLDAARTSLEACCAVLDRQLSTTPFLAGDTFSLADICYMPYLEYAMVTAAKPSILKFGHVASWWNRLSERPTWRKVTGKS